MDRVLHDRHNVRDSTRLEVEQAIRDLDKQRSQLRLAGRKYLFDVVMQAPQRFSSAFREAVEAELPALPPAVVRSRFHFPSRPRSPRCEEWPPHPRARQPLPPLASNPDVQCDRRSMVPT